MVTEALENKIREILNGIDKQESQDENGWWETSTGAEFGARKLEEVIEAIKSQDSQEPNQ